MSFLSFLAGLSAKMYDDLNDNFLLQPFHHQTFLEFLKGIHFISFTAVSIQDPLFFIISCIANVLHYFGNREGYSEHYEHSLLYSFLLLFIILDFRKINDIHTLDKWFLLVSCLGFLLEPFLMRYYFQNSEFSYSKMMIRTLLCILTSIMYFMTTSISVKHFFSYCIGYGVFSTIVQYYSLTYEHIKQNQVKEDQKEDQVKDQKEQAKVKEDHVKEQAKEQKEEQKEEQEQEQEKK